VQSKIAQIAINFTFLKELDQANSNVLKHLQNL